MARQINGNQAKPIAQLGDESIPNAHIESPSMQQDQVRTVTVNFYV